MGKSIIVSDFNCAWLIFCTLKGHHNIKSSQANPILYFWHIHHTHKLLTKNNIDKDR